MQTQIKNLFKNLSIQQGAKWEEMDFNIEGDWTLATPKLQIRRTYFITDNDPANDNVNLLAEALFRDVILFTESDITYTKFSPYIPATITQTIPVTNLAKGIKEGQTVWVYDLKLIMPDPVNNEIPFKGFVEVNPMVTN